MPKGISIEQFCSRNKVIDILKKGSVMKNFIEMFFLMLNQEKIKYAVLRNYDLLPNSLDGSDIDMWVEQEDCERFFNLTMAKAEEYGGHLVSYIWKRHEPKICLMGADWGVQIDVYTGLVPIGNYEFYTGEIIARHIVEHNGIKVISKKWCAIESLLKEVLNTGNCDRKDKFYNEAHDAIAEIDEEELKEGLPMFSDNYIKLLKKVGKEAKSKCLIDRIYEEGRKELTKKVKGATFDKVAKFKRLLKRPGYMIAILGTDGAGKSAIYESMLPHLKDAFHNGMHYRHLRPHMLPDIGVLIGKRERVENVKVCANPHAKKSSGFIGSLIRLAYYLQDYIWGYWLKIWPKIAIHADVYVMDRYYYDYYIDQTRSLTNLPNWIIKFFDIFVPSPDVIICLGGNPEKIFERKPETSLEDVKNQTAALHDFCNSHKKAFWVDTTEYDLETSTKIALKGLAERMGKRFKDIKKL